MTAMLGLVGAMAMEVSVAVEPELVEEFELPRRLEEQPATASKPRKVRNGRILKNLPTRKRAPILSPEKFAAQPKPCTHAPYLRSLIR